MPLTESVNAAIPEGSDSTPAPNMVLPRLNMDVDILEVPCIKVDVVDLDVYKCSADVAGCVPCDDELTDEIACFRNAVSAVAIMIVK